MNRRSRTLLLLAAVLAVSAGPPRDEPPDELIRQGNAAFLRGDIDQAEQLYAAAAERSQDPGLVAFNKAAVLAQKGEWREAELHYLRALDDRAAPPERRAKALYNRGVCLLERGGQSSVYRTAIACFEQSLDLFAPDDPLAADARHNLELAKLLWNKALAAEKAQPRPNEPPEGVPPEPPPEGQDPDRPDPGTNPEGPGGNPGLRHDLTPGQPPRGANARETTQKAPGAGNLPVVLDKDQPQPLSPEDTRAILRRVAERLERDRRANARMLAGPERPDVRDW